MIPRLATLDPRDRRALLAGALVLVVVVLGLRVAPAAARGARQLQDDADAARRDLTRARSIIAQQPAARDSFAAQATRLVSMAPRLVSGQTSAEAAATLVAHLVGLAARDRIRVTAFEPIPDSGTGYFVRVAARLAVQGDSRGLAHWLACIEEGRPALAVLALDVATVDATAPADRAEVLRVDVVVGGWSMHGSGRP